MEAIVKIEEQYDKLFKYCYMKTRDIHVAEDITQETFLKFLNTKDYKDMDKKARTHRCQYDFKSLYSFI